MQFDYRDLSVAAFAPLFPYPPLQTVTRCDAKCYTSVESDGWRSRTLSIVGVGCFPS